MASVTSNVAGEELTRAETDELRTIEGRLGSAQTLQEKTSVWTEVLRFYEHVIEQASKSGRVRRGQAFDHLYELADAAFAALGGMPDFRNVSLRDYDSQRYGPFLGVSDEGAAAARIRDALLQSPKVLAAGRIDPLIVGGAVDAERLGGAGETPAGPDEYRAIQLACTGRVLTTTNVNTRMNLRYYHSQPLVVVRETSRSKAIRRAVSEGKKRLLPFVNTPDGKPRPVRLYLFFVKPVKRQIRLAVLNAMREKMQAGAFCDPRYHKPGLLVQVKSGRVGSNSVCDALELGAQAKIGEVAVQGVERSGALQNISLPGLLNFFDRPTTNKILREAEKRGISVRAWAEVDVDSMARSTWASLQVARRMGLYLGKYGLPPLTTTEGDYVIGRLQSWFKEWSAAPAFYIDYPVVTPHQAFGGTQVVGGVKSWLDIAKKHGVRVVLIDTADKAKGRHLVKRNRSDKVGILTLGEVEELDSYARALGVKVLWAGGISALQAYEFGKLGVFGIYVTSATTRRIAVSGDYAHDPSLSNEREPTYRGVYRVKMLLEAGFVERRLGSLGQSAEADGIAGAARALIRVLPKDAADDQSLERRLARLLLQGWKKTLG